MIPQVVASERGTGQTARMGNRVGVVCAGLWEDMSQRYPAERQSESVVVSGSGLGWSAVDGESPVRENPAPA